MRHVSISELKANPDALMAEIADGDEHWVIVDEGEPIAWLTHDPEALRKAEAVRQLTELRERIARDHPQSLEPFDIREALGRD